MNVLMKMQVASDDYISRFLMLHIRFGHNIDCDDGLCCWGRWLLCDFNSGGAAGKRRRRKGEAVRSRLRSLRSRLGGGFFKTDVVRADSCLRRGGS